MRSMTGYSKLSYQDENFELDMQIKSVNNKNLNLKIKLPYNLNFLEGAIRTVIAKKVSRGSVDVKIEFNDLRDLKNIYTYDKEQTKAYMNILLEMENEFEQNFTNKMDILIRNLNVIKKNDIQVDESEYLNFILNKLEELLIPFLKTREEEGERLKEYIMGRVSILEDKIAKIKEYKDIVVVEYKEKLLNRLAKVAENIEYKEEDILKEILLFTDKADISEEISRIDSHLIQLKKDLNDYTQPLGKKIDFILQEIFRELNTTGVKSNYYEISKLIVECKNELEKIREQSMNIE